MAKSPAHKFGQLIGNLLEELVGSILAEFASKNGLYLDCQKNPRPARKGKKVKWEDPYGNVHDLDYVLERGGTDDKTGTPVAFVEVAWRRYTRHSRNKAQEIQGAILPIAEKHQWSNPFLGAVLAGEFTDGSIEQLSSLGFHILHIPYETITAAFLSQGLDADFDESTPTAEFRKRVKAIESAPAEAMQEVKRQLGNENTARIYRFLSYLNKRLARMIERIVVVPLYGRSNEFNSIGEALHFIDRHTANVVEGDFRRYDVLVSFSNGDKAEGSFREKEKVCEFLKFIAKQ